MNPLTQLTRTQQIGLVIGGCVALMMLYYAYSAWASWHTGLDQQISDLQVDVSKLDAVDRRGRQAEARLAKLRQRGLPGDVENARRLYRAWLTEQFEEAGFSDIQINPGPGREQARLFVALGFTVSGRGNLKQVSEFLHRFHSVDLLHRFNSVVLRPVKDSKQLDLVAGIEAITFLKAPHGDQLRLEPSDRLPRKTLDAYLAAILPRNLLGAPNRPPTLARIGSQRLGPSDSVRITARGTDPDSLDVLTYSLVDPPEGARIDPKTGQVSWRPPGIGKYELAVRVTDDGWPAKSAEERVAIEVATPPPPPQRVVTAPRPDPGPPQPRLELGRFTFFTAVTEQNGVPEAWFVIRNTEQVLQLRPGAPFNIAGLQGKIAEVRGEQVELEILGRRYLVRLGESVSQAVETRARVSQR